MNAGSPLPRPDISPALAPRSVTILGATGSIGTSTLDLIKRERARYRLEAVSAHRNAAALAKIARDLDARFAAIADPDYYGELKAALAGTGVEAAAGKAAVIEAACRPADWVMAAITGSAGLKATLAAADRGAMVAIANKEPPAQRCCQSIRSTMLCSRRLAPVGAKTCAASCSPPLADRFALGRSRRSARQRWNRRCAIPIGRWDQRSQSTRRP
jgi:hypothetical protein